MDDELQQLEAELKRLRPAAPSNELIARVGRELAPGSAGGSPVLGEYAGQRPFLPRLAVRWLWALALPATAVVVFVFSRFASQLRPQPLPPGTPTMQASLKPVAAENLLVSARDEGLVTLGDGTTARRERLQFLDTITWKDPRSNASLTWRVPREEVRVVPVSFQ